MKVGGEKLCGKINGMRKVQDQKKQPAKNDDRRVKTPIATRLSSFPSPSSLFITRIITGTPVGLREVAGVEVSVLG
jgi:hypothetical protein